jgi:hypothetical protein
MLRTTAIGLAAAASLSLAALTPAFADVPQCMKQPNADTCPTMGTPTPSKASEQGGPRNIKHTRYHSVQSPSKG